MNNPNLIFNLAGVKSVKLLRSMKHKSVLLVLFCLLAITVQAQDRGAQRRVLPMKAFLSSLEDRNDNGAEKKRVESLMRDVQPAVYFSQGKPSLTGSNPVVIFSDPASLSALRQLTSTDASSIEMLTVKVQSARELQALDFAPLSVLPQLRYVQIAIEAPVPDAALQTIPTGDGSYQVYYNSVLIN